ncbi:MAG: hypothetical protein HYR60_00985 [Acidobacteria bacterium]|nr:hypothetical protein [Acidobacteriota bacterium]
MHRHCVHELLRGSQPACAGHRHTLGVNDDRPPESELLMARAMELDFLMVVPRYFVYIALAAWLATFAGLGRTLWAGFRGIVPAAEPRPR